MCDLPYLPRSGEEGEKVNCYRIAIDKDASPFLLVHGIRGDYLIGQEWDGLSYSIEKELLLSDISKYDFLIVHYYGLNSVKFSGIYDFLIHKFTKWWYLKAWVRRTIGNIDQYYFDKQKLVTKQRTDLLRFMMDEQIDKANKGIGLINLMTKLYSIKWVMHPEGDQQQEKLLLYLNSLIASEDLEQSGTQYIVTGKAISTIEKYEEEERRHAENVKMQKWMLYLTIMIVLLAVIQSGLIKFPVLLNLD
jgi:hypothetical protein